MGEMSWLLAILLVCTTTIFEGEGRCTLLEDGACQANVICTGDTSGILSTVTDWKCGKTENYDCTQYYTNRRYYEYKTCQRFSRKFEIMLTLNACSLDTFSLRDTFHGNDLQKSLASRVKKLIIESITIDNDKIKSLNEYFNNITMISLFSNDIGRLDLNTFFDFIHLKNISVTHNSIKMLENTGATTKISSVNYIDLSFNLIQFIPNNYFSQYPQLKVLNLANNLIESFEILSFEGISQLETLSLSNNRILKIGQTFARFVNLKDLSLDHNNLTSIEEINFSTMIHLEKLNLSANQLNNIKNLSFENLVRLETLSLSYNLLSDMGVNLHNTALHTLDISNNKIKHIASEAFKGKNITEFNMNDNNLTGVIEKNTFDGIYTDVLDLSCHQITSLDSNAFTGLHVQVLNLSSNAIRNVSNTSFESVRLLKELDISHNNLSIIDFETSDLKELVVLNLQSNRIEYISGKFLKGLISLRQLDLSLNQIKKIEPNIFLGSQKIEFIDLSGNNLTNTLEVNGLPNAKNKTSIKNNTFSGLTVLKTLNLSNNKIDNLEYEAFINTGSIEVLHLSYNFLQEFLINTSTLISIEELHLDNNKIRNITNETFCGLINLRKLYLSDNNIIKIHTKLLTSLTNLNVLDLSFNTAMEAGDDFSNFMSLKNLSLANIKKQFNFEYIVNSSIERLDLSSSNIISVNSINLCKNENVKYLELKANKITSIDKFSFKNMSLLTHLDLSFNMISFIQPGTFLHTNHLKDLNLHSNRLQLLQFGVLGGLVQLEKLNLSSNVLHTFKNNVLHNTPTVSVLSLDDNDLKEFRFEDFVGSRLRIISIGNNPISCHEFVNLKKYPHNFIVTAENIDYHNENVDGIKCKSSLANTSFVLPANVSDVNSTVAIFAFTNAVDNFRYSLSDIMKNFSLSIDKLSGNNLASTLGQQSSSDAIVNILKQMHNNYNETQTILYSYLYAVNSNYNKSQAALNKYLNEISAANNKTINHATLIEEYLKNITKTKIEHVNLGYGNRSDLNVLDNHLQEKIKILNYEKEKIVQEMQIMFQSLKDSANARHDASTEHTSEASDVKPLMYFIATCLLMYVVMSGFFFLIFYKKWRYTYERHCSSTQPIENSIELHEH